MRKYNSEEFLSEYFTNPYFKEYVDSHLRAFVEADVSDKRLRLVLNGAITLSSYLQETMIPIAQEEEEEVDLETKDYIENKFKGRADEFKEYLNAKGISIESYLNMTEEEKLSEEECFY